MERSRLTDEFTGYTGTQLSKMSSYNSSLSQAVKRGDFEEAKRLVNHPRMQIKLANAIKERDFKKVKRLVKSGARTYGTRVLGWTHLTTAVIHGNKKIFNYLLKFNKNYRVNAVNFDKRTALYYAICENNLSMVAALLAVGASVEESLKGETPLDFALWTKADSVIVELLRDLGGKLSE